ncbi:MAG TPA: glycosyltransferase family 1 protein [Thermoanaerobaculia bacterium]|nr:glycosyltransferase family 1 protein [Thermoanaerobaculia bacterium]
MLRRFRALFMPRPAILVEIARTLPTVRVTWGIIGSHIIRGLVELPRRLARRPAPLRIGVDIRSFYEPLTGVGWYLHYLLAQLASRDDVEIIPFGDSLTTDDGPRLHAEVPGGARVQTIDMRGQPVTRFTRPIARAGFALAARLHRCELFFAPNYFLPGALSRIASRRVVTVHDLTFRRHPELLQSETLENLQREMQREIFRADAVICVSQTTRADLLEFFPTDPGKVFAIQSGLAPVAEAGEPPASLPGRFLLFVSTIEPRKNLDALLTAFEVLKDRGSYPGSLVVVGKIGWKSDQTVERLRTSRWSSSILHLDYLSRGELSAVYARAELFIFPSIYEGFGFPLLEAMAQGVPTIASRSSSLPEVGGDATIYFDPASSAELADAIERVTSDPSLAETLRQLGRERAALFDWARAADETLALFRRAAER